MRVGSLFSGIGEFDLGFERAGFEVAWQCEKDAHARKVLARHWPGVSCYEDVQTLDGASVDGVDVLVGGFPCQDLSVAGKRAGLGGERSGLWYEFARLLGEMRPAWVVIENVPGLRSSQGGRDLAIVLRGLAELGYMGSWWSPDAQYFGLAQRRERVFIVGHLGSGRAIEVLPDTAGLCGHPAPRREAGKDVAGTLGASAGSRGNGLGSGSGRGESDNLIASPLMVPSHGATWKGGGTDNLIPVGIDGADNLWVIQDARGVREKAQNGIGIAEPGTPMYTLDSVSQHAVYVPHVVGALSDGAHMGGGLNGQDARSGRIFAPNAMVRRLIPTECERLQGFPDGWTDGQSDSHRYRQLGNAVAVPVVEWIARRIAAV